MPTSSCDLQSENRRINRAAIININVRARTYIQEKFSEALENE